MKKQPSTDVAKALLCQITFMVNEALNFGEDMAQTLREIQRVAESAHNALCVDEVVHGTK